MNKNLFRIVFNKARGMLMVVADIAGFAGKGHSAGSGHTLSKLIKLTALSFSLWLAMGLVIPAQAAIIADGHAPGNQQPPVINTANGIPQVNIQTPSAGGVSRNAYSQFDVDKKGAILNNSHANVQSQLGGMVTANPWLARGKAKVILNEVNTRDPSQLNGFIEVAGRKAQVVIANPSGITCDGCGFINASRSTLTTGNVQMQNGIITGYDVSRGEIVVLGSGLDGSRQSHTDLIARSVKVNAGIWASELSITTGANQTDAAYQGIRAKSADPSSRPGLALDISQLGGMYAGKIRLIGTEKGVGVRNAGNIGASAGDVVINADGTISNSGSVTASEHIQVATKNDVINDGTLHALVTTVVKADNSVVNSGIIAARGNTTVTAAAITSHASGALAAGMNADGTLGGSSNLTLNSDGILRAHGQNLASATLMATGKNVDLSNSQTSANRIDVTAINGDISLTRANIDASQELSLSTARSLNNDGGKLVADKLTLTASHLSNQQGVIQQRGHNDLTLAMRKGINNREGTIASNGKNMTLSSSLLQNQQGEIIHAGDGQLLLLSEKLEGESGTLISNGSLELTGNELDLDAAYTQAEGLKIIANSLSHQKGQLIQAGNGPMTISILNNLNNEEGEILSKGKINLNAGTLNNQRGSLIAAEESDLALTVIDEINNRDGVIASGVAWHQ